MMEQYHYEGLQDNNHIRRVTIHPGTSENAIVVTLDVVVFDETEPPEYEALSYVWGSEENPGTIQVGLHHPRKLPVTQNLLCALQHLRFVNEPRVMWIDAICIDQQNDEEKGPQVARMGDIYRLAANVVVWLGPAIEGERSEYALALMYEIGCQVDVAWELGIMEAKPGCEDPSIADIFAKYPPRIAQALPYILQILRRPWFDRLWIRQEVYLSGRATVLCGTCAVPWSGYRKGLFCILRKPELSAIYSRMVQLSGLILQRFPLRICDLRLAFGTVKCRDPRDRIFAVSSLLHESDRALCPSPDYISTGYIHVFKELIVNHFNYYKSFELLAYCELLPEPAGPSWVPDWSRSSGTHHLPAFFASAQLVATHEVPENGVLRVSGVVSTRVKSLEPAPDFNLRGGRDHLEALAFTLRTCAAWPFPGDKRRRMEELAACFACGAFDENCRDLYHDSDPHAQRNSLDEVRQVVERLIVGPPEAIDLSPGSAAHRFYGKVLQYMSGRQIMLSDDLRLGTAPLGAQVGDYVCVVIGCSSPLLLRPVYQAHTHDNGGERGTIRLQVVGECFQSGLTQGEALLGPLPEGVWTGRAYTKEYQAWYYCFIDKRTGISSHEDPRLERLPIDLDGFRARLKIHPGSRLRIDVADLKDLIVEGKRVDVRTFDLV